MTPKSLEKVSFLIPVILFFIALSVTQAAGQAQANLLEVELYEWGIDVSNASPPAGPTRFYVTNVGTQPHTFRIEGGDASLTFPTELQVGETRMMHVNLQGGEYTITCPLDDHAERGMQVALSVTGGEPQEQTQPAEDEQTTTPEGTAQTTPTAEPQETITPGEQTTPTAGATQAETPQASPSPEGETGNGEQSGEQLVQQGEEIFAGECAQCHGQEGEGQVGPALAGNSLVTQEDPSEVIDTVLHGRGQMPAFQDQLSSEEIAAVVSYIRDAWENNAPPVTPDQIGEGEGGGEAGGQPEQQVTLELSVQDNQFSQESLSAPAGARVVINFTNNDSRPHNFSLYRDASALEELFLGRIFSGPDQSVTYEFTAPAQPGDYHFQCDVHPYMNGTFTVEP